MLVISIILHRHSWEHPSHQQHPRSSLSSVRCSITLKCLCCLRAGFPGSIQFSSDTYAAAWAQMFDRFQNVCAAYVQAFLRASKLPATPTQQPELRCSIIFKCLCCLRAGFPGSIQVSSDTYAAALAQMFSNVYAAYVQAFLRASKSPATPTQQPELRCSIIFKCLCCLRAGFPGSIQVSSDTYAAALAQMGAPNQVTQGNSATG